MPSHTPEEKKRRAKELRDRLKANQETKSTGQVSVSDVRKRKGLDPIKRDPSGRAISRERTPEEIQKARQEGQEFIREREKRRSREGGSTAQAQRIASEQDQAKFEREQRPGLEKEELEVEEGERLEGFREETGSGKLLRGIEELILNPPDLSPVPISQLAKGLSEGFLESRQFQPLGITGVSATKKLIENPEKELKRAGVELAVGSAIGGLSLGALSIMMARARGLSIMKVGGSGANLAKSLGALALFGFGADKAFDFRGGELETYRKAINGVKEDGERVEALSKNGLPTGDTIEILEDMHQEVITAESRIKQLGNLNLAYRVSDEHINDMNNVRSARIALARRIRAVENIASTGSAILNPEQLLFVSEQIGHIPKSEQIIA